MSPDAIRLRWRSRKRAQRAIEATKCEDCGARRNLQRHHDNIRQSLKVRILCQRCHAAWHVARGSWPNRWRAAA